MAELLRLQKYISECGVMSRRGAEGEIAAGRVTVNGRVAQVGDKINPEKDEIAISGRKLPAYKNVVNAKKVYVMLYKPRGYVTTMSDERNRKIVTDLIRKDVPERVYPVGRLDLNSEGLLFLTNDGELTKMLTHPSSSVTKIYHVTVRGMIKPDVLQALNRPMEIEGYIIRAVDVEIIKEDELKSLLRFSLREGKNRQIRKMLELVGIEVMRLKRVAVGDIGIGDLKSGEFRHLTDREVEYLKRL